MRTIRTRIIAITVSSILISILLFGGIGILFGKMESDQSSVEKLDLICENQQKTLNAYLNGIKQSIDMVSRYAGEELDSVALVEGGVVGAAAKHSERTLDQEQQLDAYLAQYCSSIRRVFGSVANHTSGVVTYYYCLSPDVSETEHGFFYSKVGKTEFEEQEPLDARTLDPEDLEHTTWYYTTIRQGRPSWIGPYKAHFLGEVWTVSYITPIYKAGTLIGVLGMDILLDTIASQVSSLHVYRSGFAALMDGEGRILYHPELEMNSFLEEEKPELQIVSDILHRESSGGEMIRYQSRGQERQLSFATLVNGMKLVVASPVSEINENWRSMIRAILLAGGIVLVAFAVLTTVTMRRVIDPLRRLTAAAKRVSAGDYSVPLDYSGNDEVGVLTEAFCQMRDHLQIYIRDLNSKAYQDSLTGIRNKSAFDTFSARLNDIIQTVGQETDPEFAVVMFDCNRLKTINDEYGHDKGDIYLKSACDLICDVYANSPVFRLGGDEFAAFLQRANYETRDELLAAFDRLMEEHNTKAEHPWERVDLARGMAQFDPAVDRNIQDVLRRADERMYADKKEHKRLRQE